MAEDYFKNLINIQDLLKKLDNTAFRWFDDKNEGKLFNEKTWWFCYTPRYLRDYEPIAGAIKISNLLGIELLDKRHDDLLVYSQNLQNPQCVDTKRRFKFYTNLISEIFTRAHPELLKINKKLVEEEKIRLNEAIHCLLENCYYASVTMAVSATEFRLLKLMKFTGGKRGLDKLTLGQLISEYLENKETYSKVISKEFEPLLELCNTYRIFSVHPKKKKISRRVATSILNLAIEFLLTQKMPTKAKPKK